MVTNMMVKVNYNLLYNLILYKEPSMNKTVVQTIEKLFMNSKVEKIFAEYRILERKALQINEE